MVESRSRLTSRKLDIFAAIRRLEQDHQDGVVDDDAYHAARHRYELEAAEILERLDTLPPDLDPVLGTPPPPVEAPRWRSWPVTAGAIVLIAAALVVILLVSTHNRSGNQAATGDVGATGAGGQTSPALEAALKKVAVHPRSVTALIGLGNAYFDAGNAGAADQIYRRAMAIAPANPEAPTLDAMALGAKSRYPQALALLSRVERAHPAYARAWLLDGLLAGHNQRGYIRAIAAWRHFLALEPHNPISTRVRQWLAAARRAQARGTR